MSNNVEKTFEERLASLKKGCIILGVLQAYSFISAINNYSEYGGNLTTVIISGILLAMLYFMYKYTKEQNPIVPTLERIYGIILLIDGIVLSLTIVGIIFGVIYIVLALGIFKEAKYFEEEIKKEQ